MKKKVVTTVYVSSVVLSAIILMPLFPQYVGVIWGIDMALLWIAVCAVYLGW